MHKLQLAVQGRHGGRERETSTANSIAGGRIFGRIDRFRRRSDNQHQPGPRNGLYEKPGRPGENLEHRKSDCKRRRVHRAEPGADGHDHNNGDDLRINDAVVFRRDREDPGTQGRLHGEPDVRQDTVTCRRCRGTRGSLRDRPGPALQHDSE